WVALLLFAVAGATAHLFPVRSALGGATYMLTNVFLIAGAAVLPAPLLTPLALVALTPERWRRRGRPGLMIGWLFNVSQSAVALHVAGAFVHLVGVTNVASVNELFVLVLAATL